MNILVTGHNGYIGSAMVPILRAAGHRVTGLDTCYYEECSFVDNDDTVPCVRKDIRDLTITDFQGFEVIIHLAALSNDQLCDFNPALTHDINHVASVHLATLAKKAGIERFLYSSSCSVYGKAAPNELLTENSPLAPLGAYAISKVCAEVDIAKLADDNFSPTFLRNATNYGVSPRLRTDLILNDLVGWAYTTGKMRVLKDAIPWRPMIHVKDVAHVFTAVLAAPTEAVHNQTFNVGVQGENYRICDLIELVRETIPGCKIEYANEKASDLRSYRVDFSKLEKCFPNLRLSWRLSDGIKELYRAFQQVQLNLQDLQGGKYIRINQLKYLLDSGWLDSELRWKKPTPFENRVNNER